MSEFEKKWIEDIPVGKENAICRATLARIWGISDREARERISRLRRIDDGGDLAIVSNSNSGGYYRTDNIDEIIHFVAECKSRSRHILDAATKAERILMESRHKQ